MIYYCDNYFTIPILMTVCLRIWNFF